jgi:hypothetical protein
VGSFVVSVSVTDPELISVAVGVYVAVRDVLLGENVPAPPLHVPEEAEPLTDPASVTAGVDEQTV